MHATLQAIKAHLEKELPNHKIAYTSRFCFEITLENKPICRLIISSQTVTCIYYANHYLPYEIASPQLQTINLAHPQALQKIINLILY